MPVFQFESHSPTLNQVAVGSKPCAVMYVYVDEVRVCSVVYGSMYVCMCMYVYVCICR